MKQYKQTREIIRQLSYRNTAITNKSTLDVGNNAMLVFTGKNHEIPETITPLQKLKSHGYNYDVVFTVAASRLLDIDIICKQLEPRKVIKEGSECCLEDVLEGIDCIIVSAPTQNTAFKLAMGIQDQMVPRLLWEALWMGIPLWMNLDSLYLYKGKETPSKPLKEIIKGNIEKLEKMGVKQIKKHQSYFEMLKGDSKFPSMALSEYTAKIEGDNLLSATVITEKDLFNYTVKDQVIYVAEKAIITPLARDVAKDKGIKFIPIQKQHEGDGGCN